MKMEQTECSETSAYKIQRPGNYPEESIQHSEHGESLNYGTIVKGVFYNLHKIRRLSSVTACVYLGYTAAGGTGHTSCVWT